MAKEITIQEIIENVKNGDFPEVNTNNEEKLVFMSSNLVANFSVIVAHTLLNDIPEENAEEIYAKRTELFDKVIATVNTYNHGRASKLIKELEAITSEAENENVMWPSKKIRNNVLLFITQYFAWDDKTRLTFFGAEESDFQQPQEAPEVVEGEVVE